MRRPVAILVFGLFLAVFFVYFIFSFRSFWRGPQIVIDYPADGASIDGFNAVVTGRARDVSKLELNGRPLYTDENGSFKEALILSPGLNIIEVRAEGRFGGKLSEKITVLARLPE